MPIAKKVNGVAPPEYVMFGDLSTYTTGGGMPEGDYILNYKFQMFGGFRQDYKGPLRLGIMLDATSIEDGTTVRQQFYPLGKDADKSFTPDAETGKRLLVVPNGPHFEFTLKTNWAIHLDSLQNSGLTPGTLTNDLSVLDGTWAHLTSIPEPAERKDFQSNAAMTEVAASTPRRENNKIVVVSYILDGGAPWEGGGGSQGPAKGKAAAGKVAPAAKPVAAPVAAAPAEYTDEEVLDAASEGVAEVLGAKPDGDLKLKIKTSAYAAVVKTRKDEDMASKVAAFLNNDENFVQVIGGLGYKLSGPKVVVA